MPIRRLSALAAYGDHAILPRLDQAARSIEQTPGIAAAELEHGCALDVAVLPRDLDEVLPRAKWQQRRRQRSRGNTVSADGGADGGNDRSDDPGITGGCTILDGRASPQ